MSVYYDQKYYQWQRKAAEYGGMIDLWKFSRFIKNNDKVLDFGCGDGNILEKLNCRKKYGIEINATAIKEAQKRGILVYKNINKIPSGTKFDVIISHHALEHVENPYLVLKKLKDYLKIEGLIIFVVPVDDWRTQKRYFKEDINKHLFTWNPLLLGNLFVKAGFKVKKVEMLTYAWFPLSRITFKILPKFIYYFLCKVWSIITLNRQIRIIATR